MELPTKHPPQRALPSFVSALLYSTVALARQELLREISIKNASTKSRTPEDIVKLLTTDLRLTTAYLQVHPKVYWIWNHRKWCLESVPPGPDDSEGWRNQFWKMELMLIEKMLDADARNCKESRTMARGKRLMSQSTPGITGDTSSAVSRIAIHRLGRLKTNSSTRKRRLRPTFQTFQLGTVGRKSWGGCGKVNRPKRSRGRRIVVGEDSIVPDVRAYGQNLSWSGKPYGRIPEISRDGCTTAGWSEMVRWLNQPDTLTDE